MTSQPNTRYDMPIRSNDNQKGQMMKDYAKTPATATIRCTRHNGSYDVWKHLQKLQESQFIRRAIWVRRDELEDAAEWSDCEQFVSIDGEMVSLDECDYWF